MVVGMIVVMIAAGKFARAKIGQMRQVHHTELLYRARAGRKKNGASKQNESLCKQSVVGVEGLSA